MGNKKSTTTTTTTNSEKPYRSTPSTYLTEDDFIYLKENTNFERNEILEWHNSFMNECPNGYLTKKQLVKTFEKIYPNGKPQKMCTQLFNTFDVDKNGKIDFCEYMCAISHLASQDIRKKLQLTFRIYDSDHNGVVNRKELEKMIVAILELNGVENNNPSSSSSLYKCSTPCDLAVAASSSSSSSTAKAKVANIFKRFNKDINDSIDENEFVNTCLGDEFLISLFAEYRV